MTVVVGSSQHRIGAHQRTPIVTGLPPNWAYSSTYPTTGSEAGPSQYTRRLSPYHPHARSAAGPSQFTRPLYPNYQNTPNEAEPTQYRTDENSKYHRSIPAATTSTHPTCPLKKKHITRDVAIVVTLQSAVQLREPIEPTSAHLIYRVKTYKLGALIQESLLAFARGVATETQELNQSIETSRKILYESNDHELKMQNGLHDFEPIRSRHHSR